MEEQALTARIISPDCLSAHEIAAWENLCATLPHLSSPFLSPHYARAVSEAGIDARICVIYHNQTICGFLPYQFRSHLSAWTGTAEPVGGEMTDYFGLIAAPGFSIASRRLLQLAKLNYLGFSHLDESQLDYGLIAEQPRIGLRIRLPRDIDRPLEALLHDSQKYLKDSERRKRQLVKEVGPIEFTLDVRNGRMQILNELIQRKRSQYMRTKAPDALESPWKRHLLQQLSQYEFDSCRGILSTLSAGGKWVAAHFGILGNGILQYWLPVYNPEYAKYAPGRLLIHHIIEMSSTAGIHTIDRGEGDTSSKRELANEEHRLLRGAWHNGSVASGIARGFYSLKWRMGS